MIVFDSKYTLPSRVLVYIGLTRALVFVPLIFLASFTVIIGNTFQPVVGGSILLIAPIAQYISVFMILSGFVYVMWSLLWYIMFSYTIAANYIKVDQGVLVRETLTLNYIKIQRTDHTRNILQILFGITALHIWVAQQDQFVTESVTEDNTTTSLTTGLPTLSMLLKHADADELQNILANKSAVQLVNLPLSKK